MKNGMSLQDLLTEVIRQNEEKRDYTTSTQDNIRMVYQPEVDTEAFIVLLKNGSDILERFTITDNAHQQISTRLGIPVKYYRRLLADHTDLVVTQVNALFEREPQSRLVRVLDGKVRAFLSNRYLRLDNAQVLEETLPIVVNGDLQTELLSTNVGENKMHLKCLFTGDELAQEITNKTKTGETRIIRPGFRISNSETGHGSLNVEGFFYDGYCTNGQVYNMENAISFRRTHLGAKLVEGNDFQVVSDKTKRLEDAAIVSQVQDILTAMSSKEFADSMGDTLRAKTQTPECKNPRAAVELAVKELSLKESEGDSILETFLQDGDYSQWGLSSAVTAVANQDDVTYERACDLENVGAKILSLSLNAWTSFATVNKVAA